MGYSQTTPDECIATGRAVVETIRATKDKKASPLAQLIEAATDKLVEAVQADAEASRADEADAAAGRSRRDRALVVDRSWDSAHRAFHLRLESERAFAEGSDRAEAFAQAQRVLYPQGLQVLVGSFEAELGFQERWGGGLGHAAVKTIWTAIDGDRLAARVKSAASELQAFAKSAPPTAGGTVGVISPRVAWRGWIGTVEAAQALLGQIFEDEAVRTRVLEPLVSLSVRSDERARKTAARSMGADGSTPISTGPTDTAGGGSTPPPA